jgi:hypothetical protein
VEISTSRNQEGHQRDSREPCASLRNCGDIRIAQAAASGIGGVGCVTTTSYQSRLPDSVCRRHNCASTPLPGGHQNPSEPYDARQGGGFAGRPCLGGRLLRSEPLDPPLQPFPGHHPRPVPPCAPSSVGAVAPAGRRSRGLQSSNIRQEPTRLVTETAERLRCEV